MGGRIVFWQIRIMRIGLKFGCLVPNFETKSFNSAVVDQWPGQPKLDLMSLVLSFVLGDQATGPKHIASANFSQAGRPLGVGQELTWKLTLSYLWQGNWSVARTETNRLSRLVLRLSGDCSDSKPTRYKVTECGLWRAFLSCSSSRRTFRYVTLHHQRFLNSRV